MRLARPRMIGRGGHGVALPLPCAHHPAGEDDRAGHPYLRDEVARGQVGTVTRGQGENDNSMGDRRPAGWLEMR